MPTIVRSGSRLCKNITRQDLFAPALAQVGLAADRVIYVDACDEKSVLACFEEGVRHGGLGAVVAEVARLSMTSSRRLSLAAEASRGRTVTLKMKFNDFEIITRSRSVPVAVSSRGELERLSIALLQNEMPVPKPVRLLGVSLSALQGSRRTSRNSACRSEEAQRSTPARYRR